MAATVSRSRTNSVTTLNTAAHGLNVGNKFTLTGMTDTSFNGTWVVLTRPSTTQITFANVGPDVTQDNDAGGTTTEVVIASNTANPWRIMKTLTTTTTGTLGPYRYRAGTGTPDTLRLDVRDIGADGTWTVALKVVDPGGATGDAYTVESYTTLISKVFTPGGSCDVYLDCTAHGGSSTLQLSIYSGSS